MKIIEKYIEYLKNNPEGYWFKRKIYGWGWTPAKWQGWAVLLIWVLLFIPSVVYMEQDRVKNLIFIFLLTSVLILVCYKKGEKPKWQWGLKNTDKDS